MSTAFRPAAGGPAAVLLLLLVGCRSPFQAERVEDRLQQSVRAAIERELAATPSESRRLTLTDEPGEAEQALAQRRDELDALSPYSRDERDRYDVGVDLNGAGQDEIALTLRAAMLASVQHNLDIQVARLQPAINEADVVRALAAFDAVWFGTGEYLQTDQPSTVPVLQGIPLGSNVRASEQLRLDTGLRKPLTTGGEVSLSTELTRSENRAPGISLSPDPAYQGALRFSLSQPLLRNFGSAVNTAEIRIARNAERASIHELRSDLLMLVADTEQAYWDLVFTWQDLAIRQWLVDVGSEVRDVMRVRGEVYDALPAQYADAVAVVEQRRADVIRARRAVREASDRLKLLMNDPRLPIASEALIRPIDDLVSAPVSYDLRDAIVTAISRRPEVAQAILSIDDASIRQIVADQARLPLLDFRAEMALYGLDENAGDAYGNLTDRDFIDYLFSLAFEVPIGNRAAEAGYRRARLERSAAVLRYLQAVRQIVLDVKDALRDVVTSYELIRATRSFRVAQAENLRALLEEETLQGLTPEFLNLKFQRQQTLALARQQELQALVEYDQSLATLYRALGIGLEINQIDLIVVDPDEVERVMNGRVPRNGNGDLRRAFDDDGMSSDDAGDS